MLPIIHKCVAMESLFELCRQFGSVIQLLMVFFGWVRLQNSKRLSIVTQL